MKDITQRHVNDDNYIYSDLDDERHNYGTRQVYLWRESIKGHTSAPRK